MIPPSGGVEPPPPLPPPLDDPPPPPPPAPLPAPALANDGVSVGSKATHSSGGKGKGQIFPKYEVPGLKGHILYDHLNESLTAVCPRHKEGNTRCAFDKKRTKQSLAALCCWLEDCSAEGVTNRGDHNLKKKPENLTRDRRKLWRRKLLDLQTDGNTDVDALIKLELPMVAIPFYEPMRP